MRRLAWCSLVALFCFSGQMVASASEVYAKASYQINSFDPNGYGDSQTQTEPGGAVSASVADPNDKASASASASFGLLGTVAEIDPDIGGGVNLFAEGESYFSDSITISGDNPGVMAWAYLRLRVRGTIQQPFFVSEVTGYAQVSADLSAGSSIGGDSDSELYTASGMGSPIITVVDDILGIASPFIVGEPFLFGASLRATAEAAGLNVDPDAIKFSALFGSTAELLPIATFGAVHATISSESGTVYTLVPEPTAAVLMMLCSLAMLRRRF